MTKCMRSVLVSIAIAAATIGSIPWAQAATGLVRVRVVNVGFIIGAGGGQGALNLRGRDYPFSVSGIGLGAFGASAAEFVGRAYNLRSPYDLVGSYSAVGAGAAVVGGVRVTRLRNANGVVLELRGGQVGLELNVGVSGVTITMP
ncbi:MAG TPA: hypothetical protein VKB16_03575 [Beijerinckiaceae bacterium]|jgi:hypothetical protein|nr:hypothetical protein [Beijerinckiaceae bacterium]